MAYRVFHRSIFAKNIPADLIVERKGRKFIRAQGAEAELEKMPKDFRQLKETIKTKLEDYIETVNRESWYLCKKYYLAGLNDGINLKEEIK